MAATRAPRSAGVCFLLGIGLALAAVIALPVTRARATSGVAGPVNVTVSPTTSLADGQVVSIHADTGTSGVKLLGIVAHICKPNANITTDIRFGPDGGECPGADGEPGKGTGEASIASAGASTLLLDSASLVSTPFKAGIGTVDWTSFGPSDPAEGTARSLTCDSTHACDLVVKVTADDGKDRFFSTRLSFAGAGASTSSSSPSTSSSSPSGIVATSTTGLTVRAAADTTTTTASGTTTTTTPSGTTTTTTTTTPCSTTTTTTASDTTTTTTPTDTTTTTTPTDTTTTTIPCSTTTTTAATATTLSATTATTTPSGGALPYTGGNSRDLASAALLMIAVGLFLLGRYYKHQPRT